MRKSKILRTIKSQGSKVVFCDYFDTLAHRYVHPNYVIRLWAKYLIRELGLKLKIDELYFVRKEAETHLSKESSKLKIEIPYEVGIREVYNRLLCTDAMTNTSFEVFSEYFELADYHAECQVQYLNSDMVSALQVLKNEGYKIYCLSDFYTSSACLRRIMAFFEIEHIFADVFVSADFGASKDKGTLYPKIVNLLGIQPTNALMIGDNIQCDIKNARVMGLKTVHIPNSKKSKTNYRSAVGSDKKDYLKILNDLYKKCNHKDALPNSDYILFYTVYIERLYKHAKQQGIKDILFLSREGLYLKKLFDYYQHKVSLRSDDHINSHYLRTSRQASMLVSLQQIEEEKFLFLRKKYPNLSVYEFLKNLDLTEQHIDTVERELGLSKGDRKKTDNFLDSEIFIRLVKNDFFRKIYEDKRLEQKKAFAAYLKSFDIDFYSDGMHVADIGWGGSMQESLFDYFKGEVNVYGYYLGIREVYNVQPKTKRYGLNFTVYPYPQFSDHILKGNIELSEQLLSAPHGSVISYTTSSSTFTNEFHYQKEKQIYESYIADIQDFMFERFKDSLEKLEKICYDYGTVQNAMTDYALRIGIFASKRKIEAALKMSEGFYTNVGDFSNGLPIGSNLGKMRARGALKTTFLAPDKMFGYILRVKPLLFIKNMYFLAYLIPNRIIYNYIKLNIWFRRTILSKVSYLKYAYLK